MNRLAALAFAIALASVPATASAQPSPHQLRLEAGAAFMLPPQTDRFQTTGFSAGASYGYRLTDHLELVGRYGAALWARESRQTPSEDRFGAAHLITASARGHFLGADAPVDLWAGAGLGLAVTSAHGRLALHADIGLDVPVSAKWSLGPYARLHWVVEPNGGALQDRDAAFVELGVGAAFRPVRSEEATEPEEAEPAVTEPEPEPAVTEPEPEPEVTEPEPEPAVTEPEPEPAVTEPEPEPEVTEPEPEPEVTEPEPLRPIYFGVGSDEPGRAADPSIERLAEVLAEHPEATVRLDGYADESGDAAYNLRLSQQRADRVKERLVRAGVAADRITAVGRGERTSGAPRWNRRVEFTFTDLPPGAEL